MPVATSDVLAVRDTAAVDDDSENDQTDDGQDLERQDRSASGSLNRPVLVSP